MLLQAININRLIRTEYLKYINHEVKNSWNNMLYRTREKHH